MEKISFEKKIFKGGTLWSRNGWKKKFRFSNFQNFFLKNGFNGTWQILIETKSWNLSSFRASTEKSREIISQGGSFWPPPCRIGLKPSKNIFKFYFTFTLLGHLEMNMNKLPSFGLSYGPLPKWQLFEGHCQWANPTVLSKCHWYKILCYYY